MRWLTITVALLNSRKVQAAIATIVVAILAVFGLKDFPSEVIIAVVGAIATIGGVLINAIKAEDVASKHAAGLVEAANVTAVSSATTTTLTTPSDNVTVSTSETPKPVVTNQGLL
jgi:hypothetical protein